MKVFITGGTTGIGLNLAKLYLDAGDEVAVCGRDLKKIPEEFINKYSALTCFEVDVREQDKLANIIHEFSGGELDLVIANAGISVGSKSTVLDFDAARRILDINVMGVFNTFEPALEIMRPRKRGHLVAIGSVAGFVGLPGASAYSASKAAVYRFCESLSLDLRKSGISVTTIAPGFIDTPLTRKNRHSMPFLMSVEKGSILIKNAIDKKKILYVFPWQMKFVMYLLEKMPRAVYQLVMRLKFANYSKET